MKTEKSLLQRVQSRISIRRGMIRVLEDRLMEHYSLKMVFGLGTMDEMEIKQTKKAVRSGAESQKLDKQVFQVLLRRERDKYARYFRSKYASVDSSCLARGDYAWK